MQDELLRIKFLVCFSKTDDIFVWNLFPRFVYFRHFVLNNCFTSSDTSLSCLRKRTMPPTLQRAYSNSRVIYFLFILADKTCSDVTTSGTEWYYIIVVTLVSGIILGILLSYIAQCSYRRRLRNRKPKRNPDQQQTEADLTYEELDLTRMNQEDDYQSLRGNVGKINDATKDDDSTYTELSKIRDVEDNYQSLT